MLTDFKKGSVRIYDKQKKVYDGRAGIKDYGKNASTILSRFKTAYSMGPQEAKQHVKKPTTAKKQLTAEAEIRK